MHSPGGSTILLMCRVDVRLHEDRPKITTSRFAAKTTRSKSVLSGLSGYMINVRELLTMPT